MRGALLSLGVLLAGAPAAEMRYFSYERPLVLESQAAGQSCAALDASVFAHAAPELRDVRLYRGEVETPYVVRRMNGERIEESRLSLMNLGTREDKAVFDMAMPARHYRDVELAVNGRDFLATVTVSGSEAEGAPETKLGEYTIFDLSGQQLGRSTVLHLPESDFRYLHVEVLGSIGAKSFTGATVDSGLLSTPRSMAVAAVSTPVKQGRDTVYSIALQHGVPVDRLVIEPGADPAEFSRDVTVALEEPAGNGATRPVAQEERLLRVHRTVKGRRIDEEALAFPLASADAERVTLTIHNGSDAPLVLRSVRVEATERQLCFDAAAGASYALYYGDSALEAAVYEYAQLFAPAETPQRVELGAEAANPAHAARPDARPFTERYPWLLWAGLVVVVGVLGLVALRTAKSTPRAQG